MAGFSGSEIIRNPILSPMQVSPRHSKAAEEEYDFSNPKLVLLVHKGTIDA